MTQAVRDLKQELRGELAELLPKSQHGKIGALVEIFESYFSNVRKIEVIGCSIDVTSVEYPGGTVGLDAAGNMVSACFDLPCQIID